MILFRGSQTSGLQSKLKKLINFKNRSELNFSEMKIHKLVVDVPDMNHRHSALFDSILFPHAAVSASLS